MKHKATVGTYELQSPQFSEIIAAVKTYAVELMMFPPNLCVDCAVDSQQAGSMNEQFSRDDGKPLSAAALTWSNAAFLTAMNARDRVLPASWGASTVCHPMYKRCAYLLTCHRSSFPASARRVLRLVFVVLQSTPPGSRTAVLNKSSK